MELYVWHSSAVIPWTEPLLTTACTACDQHITWGGRGEISIHDMQSPFAAIRLSLGTTKANHSTGPKQNWTVKRNCIIIFTRTKTQPIFLCCLGAGPKPNTKKISVWRLGPRYSISSGTSIYWWLFAKPRKYINWGLTAHAFCRDFFQSLTERVQSPPRETFRFHMVPALPGTSQLVAATQGTHLFRRCPSAAGRITRNRKRWLI